MSRGGDSRSVYPEEEISGGVTRKEYPEVSPGRDTQRSYVKESDFYSWSRGLESWNLGAYTSAFTREAIHGAE